MQIKNYHIIKSLERNTLSELFLARHVHENYYVKIRVYDQFNITNEEVREAILQRLRNSYQMRHRNILATLDYGVEGRYMYQIQEHMDHGTLEELLEKAPRIPPEIASFILQEVLRGLQYAHSIGIFHGRLSPSKVLLASNGVVKVDDFQFLDLKNTFLKQVQTRLKARQQMYLAPEHLLGKEADFRCDLFSAGVLGYKMLTGKHPFLEEQAEWTVMQIIACNAKLLFELDPTLPPPLEELIEKMIEKELSARVQSAEEVLRILDGYVDHFGDVRSYEVLANFLKKPGQSVDQLDQLRAEELLQQAAQLQLQEQWNKALVLYQKAQFLKPRDKNIENEIRSLCSRLGYVTSHGKDPKFLQLEQSLRTNPDNIQILQRLATIAKSRGNLLQCVVYHKRILKIHPRDIFSGTEVRQLLETQERDTVLSPNEIKWTRWQDFYRQQRRPLWRRWSVLNGNVSLLSAVVSLAILIAGLHLAHFMPYENQVNATPVTPDAGSTPLVAGQKLDVVCEQAETMHDQGNLHQAIELLSKAPLLQEGGSAARARILLASYRLEANQIDPALDALEEIDIPSATLTQKVEIYKMKAELYRRQNRYGHAIDQYINIEALPGLPASEKTEADSTIEALQNEALLKQQQQ